MKESVKEDVKEGVNECVTKVQEGVKEEMGATMSVRRDLIDTDQQDLVAVLCQRLMIKK